MLFQIFPEKLENDYICKKNLTACILEWQYILFCEQNVAPRLAQYGWH